MNDTQAQLGIIGLGKMGGNLARQAIDKGLTCHVFGKETEEKPELEEAGVQIMLDYETFTQQLNTPRLIYLSLPAGEIIDTVLKKLLPHLDSGDVVMDGGNSYYKDSMRRQMELKEKGIYFLDTGTSGGLEGARNGACFMVGGEKEGIAVAEPVLRKLAVEGGFVHTGASGSGHFTKLVHNGIEFGMLQAIGEGYALLKDSEFDLDYPAIFHNWNHGSVIRSWLIELMEQELREQGKDVAKSVPAYIEDTGEVNWLVQDAIQREVPIPVIAQSVMELFASRTKENEAHRAIALMRHGFGGHPFGEDESIAKERTKSRIMGI